MVVNKVDASISINRARVRGRSLGLEDLGQGAGKITAVGLKLSFGEFDWNRCWRGGRCGDWHGLKELTDGNLSFD